MKTKTIKLLFATLLVGLLISCEPSKEYYPWENKSPIEKPAPVEEQVVPKQFSTNAKLLETKAGDNGYLFLLYYIHLLLYMFQYNMSYLALHR